MEILPFNPYKDFVFLFWSHVLSKSSKTRLKALKSLKCLPIEVGKFILSFLIDEELWIVIGSRPTLVFSLSVPKLDIARHVKIYALCKVCKALRVSSNDNIVVRSSGKIFCCVVRRTPSLIVYWGENWEALSNFKIRGIYYACL